uniref:Ig-like domain-containing protein n=1 Tax=Salarias fasciatus TaxID=181472 RepID=A0A672F1D5_SALFA
FSGSVQKAISAVEGQTVSLPCEAPNQENIRVVEWSRSDPGKNQYIFLYRDGHIDPDNHPSYKNRVNLKDRAMKDGDASLILRNVTAADGGIYQCFIVRSEEHENTESISSISLLVETVRPVSLLTLLMLLTLLTLWVLDCRRVVFFFSSPLSGHCTICTIVASSVCPTL